MNYGDDRRWTRWAATGAVLALSAAASAYLIRTMRDRQAERTRSDGAARGPQAGRPLKVVRGGAGEG